MKCLDGTTLAEQVEHLTYMVEELTTPPPEYADDLQCLTVGQRRMVGLLLKRSGVVPHESLIAALGIGEESNADNCLKVQISLARGRLRAAGSRIEIHSEYGIGYQAVNTSR